VAGGSDELRPEVGMNDGQRFKQTPGQRFGRTAAGGSDERWPEVQMNGGRPMAEFIQTATMAFQLIDWSEDISAYVL